MAELRFVVVDKGGGGAQIRDVIAGRVVAMFLPWPERPKAAMQYADSAARTFNEWYARVIQQRGDS